jgi:hypothetical protein
MDPSACYEGAKTGAELVTALAKLALEIKKSKNPNLQSLLTSLRGEAAKIARALEKSLDELEIDLKRKGVNLRRSLCRAGHQISKLDLIGRAAFKRHVRRITSLMTRVKGLYADIEVVFVCREQQQLLTPGIDSAYRLRVKLSEQVSKDASIETLLKTTRDALHSALRILNA